MNDILKIERLQNQYLIDWDNNFNKLILLNIEFKCPIETSFNKTLNSGSGYHLVYYDLITAEKYVMGEIIKLYGELPEWIIRKEDWVKMQKIKEII